MPRFSIIVPYYGNADTIASCVESVLCQSFSSWELILVDDGTPSNDLVTLSDERLKVIRQDHQGVSVARNRGIRESTGDYVLFLDADDYLGKDYLRDFADALHGDTSEVALSGLTRVELDGTIRPLAFPFSGIVSKEVILPSFFQIQRTNQLYAYVAGKAVRRSYLINNQLLFDESLSQAEDLDFFLQCYDKCSSFIFISNTDYHYIKRSTGSSLYQHHVDYFSLIAVQRRLRSFCKGHLSKADEDAYQRALSSWTDSAILNTKMDRLSTLPATLQKISSDSELRSLCSVHGPFLLLVIRILIRQGRLSAARFLRKVWHD